MREHIESAYDEVLVVAALMQTIAECAESRPSFAAMDFPVANLDSVQDTEIEQQQKLIDAERKRVAKSLRTNAAKLHAALERLPVIFASIADLRRVCDAILGRELSEIPYRWALDLLIELGNALHEWAVAFEKLFRRRSAHEIRTKNSRVLGKLRRDCPVRPEVLEGIRNRVRLERSVMLKELQPHEQLEVLRTMATKEDANRLDETKKKKPRHWDSIEEEQQRKLTLHARWKQHRKNNRNDTIADFCTSIGIDDANRIKVIMKEIRAAKTFLATNAVIGQPPVS